MRAPGLDREDDAKLIDGCARGDDAAWRELSDTFGVAIRAAVARVYRSRLGRMPAASESDEALQDVLVRLAEDGARRLRQFQGRSPLGAYLMAVAATCAIDRIRATARRDRRWAAAAQERADASGEGGDPPDAALLSEEEAEGLREAMSALSAKERLAVELRFWRGVPTASIARILGTSPDYVRVLLGRAMEKLREEVGKR